ncbi:MAG: hypothetical protein WCF47_06745 [Pseudolabrys sp.]
MAAQQTLNASPMQACRSSVVSAMAFEDKKTIARAAIGGASAFITVNAFKVCSRTGGARDARYVKDGSG